MSHLWQYKPILYILLFLLADKLLLVPQIEDMFTTYVDKGMDVSIIEGIESITDVSRPVVWAFGTSRSIPFRKFPEIRAVNDDGLKSTVYGRLFAVASYGYVPSVYVTEYLALRDAGLKPDAVFIEVSPFSFNQSSGLNQTLNFKSLPFRKFYRNIFFRSGLYVYEFTMTKLLSGRLRHFTFSPDQSIKVNDWIQPIWYQHRANVTPDVNPPNVGLPVSHWPSLDSSTQLSLLGMLGDYKIDPIGEAELRQMLKLLRAESIPVVLWRPAVHPLAAEYYESLNIERPFNAMIDRARQVSFFDSIKVPYVDFHTMGGVPDCSLFYDPVHVADECYPTIERILWQTLKQFYPDQNFTNTKTRQ